jgi:FkbM family methyltransferase
VRSHWVAEGHPIREFRAFKSLAREHECLVDIGAAEGIFSAAFCALTGRTAWAFEPSPKMYGRLEGLIDLNRGLDIKPFNVALGTVVGLQPVRAYPDGQFGAVAESAPTTSKMTVTTLDLFCEEHDLAPDFAKIDVEGMELAVLRGGAATFRHSVRTIVLEVHGSMLLGGEPTAEVQSVLADLGFDLFDLDFKRIRDLPAYVADKPELVSNYAIVVCRKGPKSDAAAA